MYEIFEQLLQLKGVTPYKVAKATGIAQASLSDWKSGKVKQPAADKLQKIADYFGVTVDYLLGNSHKTTKEDVELQNYLEELRTRPEMKMLFSVTKNATKEEIEKAVKIIETILEK